MSSALQFTSVDYPESDGKPMGETDQHIDETIRLRQLLKRFYKGQRVYVSGNNLVYYEQGNPKKFFSPDVMVVKGIEPRKRRVYKLWVERRPPNVVFEVTSRKTKDTDTEDKPGLYRRIQVAEYFLFDPTEDYLDPPLQGHRLTGDRHEPIAPEPDGSLVSEQLGLRLKAEEGSLNLYHLDTGTRLLTAEEALEVESEARQAEAEARRAAEAEVARLREELRRRGGHLKTGDEP